MFDSHVRPSWLIESGISLIVSFVALLILTGCDRYT